MSSSCFSQSYIVDNVYSVCSWYYTVVSIVCFVYVCIILCIVCFVYVLYCV